MEAMLEKYFEVYKTVRTCTIHSKILVLIREIIQEQKPINSTSSCKKRDIACIYVEHKYSIFKIKCEFESDKMCFDNNYLAV